MDLGGRTLVIGAQSFPDPKLLLNGGRHEIVYSLLIICNAFETWLIRQGICDGKVLAVRGLLFENTKRGLRVWKISGTHSSILQFSFIRFFIECLASLRIHVTFSQYLYDILTRQRNPEQKINTQNKGLYERITYID
jgi:hypothetical protein